MSAGPQAPPSPRFICLSGDACVLGSAERAGNALYGARVDLELGCGLAHALTPQSSRQFFRPICAPSVLPEPIEAVGAQLGISHRVHDVAMSQEVLQRAGIDPVIG
jgi:hypothetical protein